MSMNRKALIGFFAVIVLSMFAVDRMSKSWASDALAVPGTGFDLTFVTLTLVHNNGAAFGIGAGAGIVFVAIALAVVAVIIGWLIFSKEHTTAEVVSMALVAAGALGNMVDRITTGYVVDFIKLNFMDFPVFNIADICVTCGVILFIIVAFSKMRADQKEIFADLQAESAAKREREKAERIAELARMEQQEAIDAGYVDPEWGDDEEWEKSERERLAALESDTSKSDSAQ